MSEAERPEPDKPVKRDRLFEVLFKFLGPPTVDNAVQGTSAAARDGWKRDLAARKRYTEEQKRKKRELREQRKRRDAAAHDPFAVPDQPQRPFE
ncbi:hypothetical protein SAMN05444365_10464 [Micromonospora pattaloongensis]|uniref:Uncharacterized protein n=1 Tax=Micromonospora pattaloongensis TaxID=405436 RepID=A0A1H3NMT2_9ACTN|nr:hypothetical protein [Micromonospora pattaloongensis]SDY90063.1 hypothetical protein SAMN05444365_10464 [Micromonospora pattaloongensis]